MRTKIKDLPNGMIVWYKNKVLGVTGCTLPKEFEEYDVRKIIGNGFDYEICARLTKKGWIKDE